MSSGIYSIECKANGRRYIGSAVNIAKRWKEHRRGLGAGTHHSRFMMREWNKRGPDAFIFVVLLYCSRDNLLMYEQACLDGFKPEYNTAPTAGSQLGLKMSDEAKARMSEAAKRTRNFTGKTHSEESKRRISQNRKGKGVGPQSAERRAKIGAAHKGKIISTEMRARISATLTGTSTGRGKLSEDEVREIRRLQGEGLRQYEIARVTNLPSKWVHTVVAGHGYGWVK